jgi:hypothetical protein
MGLDLKSEELTSNQVRLKGGVDIAKREPVPRRGAGKTQEGTESRECELVGLEYCGRDRDAAASITGQWELADQSQLESLTVTLPRFVSAGLGYIYPALHQALHTIQLAVSDGRCHFL